MTAWRWLPLKRAARVRSGGRTRAGTVGEGERDCPVPVVESGGCLRHHKSLGYGPAAPRASPIPGYARG